MKTRFAPSPTGFLHVGSLRTALFAYLFAKQQGGTFLLRVEDTDRARLVDGAVENMVRALQWAGITIDEGVDVEDNTVVQKGNLGPYIQSERLELYSKYTQELVDAKKAYYAFDTPEELEEMRNRQMLNKQPTRYERHAMKNSFTLSAEELQTKLDAKEPHVVRFAVPEDGRVAFTDLVRGEISFSTKEIDDQVLQKADGFPTYHLAHVVDDHLMEVTHVIRGEEWLPSTPKHVLLCEAFGWEVPAYGHLSLLINEQKQKLSKRHGDVSIEDFKENGILPEALVNFVALLGWNPGDERELFTLAELEEAFSLSGVGNSASVFNREKLAWMNKQYLMSLPLEEIGKRAWPHFVNSGIDVSHLSESDGVYLQAINMERSRVSALHELPEALGFVFADTIVYDAALLVWKQADAQEAKMMLTAVQKLLTTVDTWTIVSIETTLRAWITENGYGAGNVLWPLRTALSGLKNSPSPFEIAAAIGKSKTTERLSSAIAKL